MRKGENRDLALFNQDARSNPPFSFERCVTSYVWTLIFALCGIGCGYTRLYGGDPRRAGEVARIELRGARNSQLYIDGKLPEWPDRGVEVLPGRHEISGTIFGTRRRICGETRRDCIPMTVFDRDRRGRVIGQRTEYRCRCWRPCEEDLYRAICSKDFEFQAGETRQISVRVVDFGEETPQLQMLLQEEGREWSAQCDETQPAGKQESTENIPCFPPWGF